MLGVNTWQECKQQRELQELICCGLCTLLTHQRLRVWIKLFMKIIINNLLILYKHTLDIKCDNSSVSSPVLVGHGVIKDISDWHRKSLNLLLTIRTEEEDHLFEMGTGDWVLVAAPGLDKSPGTQPRASGSQQMRRVHGRASIGFLLGYHFQQLGRHRRAQGVRHGRICLGATAPRCLFLWKLLRGHWVTASL